MEVFDVVVRIGGLGPVRMIGRVGPDKGVEAWLGQLRRMVVAPVELLDVEIREATAAEKAALMQGADVSTYPSGSEG
ncbi:hypothetical protein [Symbiobacterium terraclitae]|uniref:hypothetical protein n=1 Tax=Symbiobacterium terraclitae TaxID=557451 RepID=UPI0035B53665